MGARPKRDLCIRRRPRAKPRLTTQLKLHIARQQSATSAPHAEDQPRITSHPGSPEPFGPLLDAHRGALTCHRDVTARTEASTTAAARPLPSTPCRNRRYATIEELQRATESTPPTCLRGGHRNQAEAMAKLRYATAEEPRKRQKTPRPHARAVGTALDNAEPDGRE